MQYKVILAGTDTEWQFCSRCRGKHYRTARARLTNI